MDAQLNITRQAVTHKLSRYVLWLAVPDLNRPPPKIKGSMLVTLPDDLVPFNLEIGECRPVRIVEVEN